MSNIDHTKLEPIEKASLDELQALVRAEERDNT